MVQSSNCRALLAGLAALVPLALVLGVTSSCRSAAPDSASTAGRVSIGDIDWYVDYDAAVEVAREQDKALWVHFGENPG